MSDERIKVVWSMTGEHDERFASPVVRRDSAMCHSHDTGEEVAGDLAARYWNDQERWADCIGDDEWQATVLVRITSQSRSPGCTASMWNAA